MPIAFKCSNCGRDFSLPRRLAGTLHRCHVCGTQSPVLGEVSETVEFEAVGQVVPPSSAVKVVEVPPPLSGAVKTAPRTPSGSGPIRADTTPSGRIEPGRPCPACGKRMRFDAAACDACGRSLSMKLYAPSFVNAGLIRQFRVEIAALGALWLAQGAVIAGMWWGILSPYADAPPPELQRTAWINFGFAGGCGVLAVLTWLRVVWPTYLGIALALYRLLSLPEMGVIWGSVMVVLAVLIIAQCVRVIGWVGELRAAGLGVWARPEGLDAAGAKARV
jgi:ribosomal protein L37AE/L43A